MDSIVPYAIWLALILVVVGVAAIVLFGIRNLTYGKINPLSAIAIGVPLLIFVVLGLVMGQWDLAAIWTVMIILAMAVVALLLSGARGMSGM